jgi:hypothetical protein
VARPSFFATRANRLLRIRSETAQSEIPFTLDQAGFLQPPAALGDPLGVRPGELVSPCGDLVRGALFVLGEPGSGKSTVFNSLVQQIQDNYTSDTRPTVLRVDGAGLTELSFAEKITHQLPPTALKQHEQDNVQDADTMAFIVIDQLDESPALSMIPELIGDLLATIRRNRTRFLIACRTADFPSRLLGVLKSHGLECAVAELAPLTRSQAVELAHSTGVDGERLVSAASSVGAGVLASTPLTLEMLVRVFNREGALPRSAAEIFARGVRYLADEPDPERRHTDHSTSLDDTVAVASKIAAHLIFTGRRTLWGGREIDAAITDLGLGTLASSIEKTDTGNFHVTPEAVQHAIGTALFTGRDGNRLAFCHSTVAAYLAARYLIANGATHDQKRSLILVETYGPIATIPPQLRETASWLAALDPTDSSWLAVADPISLASHSAIVDSDHMRRVLVQSLLDHAHEVELSDIEWGGTWELDHPGLPDQLAPVLSEAASFTTQPRNWMADARIRLAVRLAGRWSGTELVPFLIALALNEHIPPYLRCLAMRFGANNAPDAVASAILHLLPALEDAEYARAVDPDDEVRGTVLRIVWPRYVSFHDIVNHLLKPPTSHFFGAFYLFLSSIGENMSVRQITEALHWANAVATKSRHRGTNQHPMSETNIITTATTDSHQVALNEHLVESLVERALVGPGFDSRVDALAGLISYSFETFGSAKMPKPLNRLRRDGKETIKARELRRKLAWAIIKRTAVRSEQPDITELFLLTAPWDQTSIQWSQFGNNDKSLGRRRQLLDSKDFEWIVDRWHQIDPEADPSMSKAVGAAASFLFNPSDPSNVEVAEAQRDTLIWSHLSHWFDAIAINSPIATQARRSEERRRARESQSSENRATFARNANQFLNAAAEGNASAFSTLAWNLQSDPETLRGPTQFNDDVRSLPGWMALGLDGQDLFTLAALRFVATSNDGRDEWLGTNQIYRDAWAGYIALAHLVRSGLMMEIPPDAWKNWCGVIIWFPTPAGGGADSIHQRLLAAALANAPDAFAEAIKRFAAVTIDNGNNSHDLFGSFNAAITEQSRDTLLTVIDFCSAKIASLSEDEYKTSPLNEDSAARSSISAAVDVFERVMDLLTNVESLQDTALDLEKRYLENRSSMIRLYFGPYSAVALFKNDPADAWQRILRLERRTDVDRRLIDKICDNRGSLDFSRLDEESLYSIYKWADNVLPDVKPPAASEPYWISAEHRAREWCDSLLSNLAGKGTSVSVKLLDDLSKQQPDNLAIAAQVIRAQASASANLWTPPDSRSLSLLLSDPNRWLVRSSKELSDAIVSVLGSISARLHTHCELLWDSWPTGSPPRGSRWWRPKAEAALCAYVSHELEIRLAARGVLVNREVMIKPTNATGAGDRTDVLVDTVQSTHGNWFSSTRAERISVVIEVKGSWNEGLRESIRTQLVNRYLPEANTDSGIYLVGWYPLHLWTAQGDDRRRQAAQVEPKMLLAELRQQAEKARREADCHVQPVLLQISRPSPTQPT